MEMPAELVDHGQGDDQAPDVECGPAGRRAPACPTTSPRPWLILASDAAGFVTGTSLIVDGGITTGPRHSWDPEAPGLFDALTAMAEAAGVATPQ
jgi:hypothetical protein